MDAPSRGWGEWTSIPGDNNCQRFHNALTRGSSNQPDFTLHDVLIGQEDEVTEGLTPLPLCVLHDVVTAQLAVPSVTHGAVADVVSYAEKWNLKKDRW